MARNNNPPSQQARRDAQRDMRQEGFTAAKCPPHVADRQYTKIHGVNYWKEKCTECGVFMANGRD